MAGIQRLVFASANAGKAREIQAMLGQDVELLLQGELAIGSIEETGATFAENALIKARHAALESGLPAVADDSGLEVDFLGGAPGMPATMPVTRRTSTSYSRNLMAYRLRSAVRGFDVCWLLSGTAKMMSRSWWMLRGKDASHSMPQEPGGSATIRFLLTRQPVVLLHN